MNYAHKTHYLNKYPSCKIEMEEDSIKVFDGNVLRVALRKNGAGMWSDEGEKEGATDRHDLAPIPKNCRAWKCYHGQRGSTVQPAEEYEQRKPFALQVASQFGGKIPSIIELQKAGWEVDDRGNVKPKVVAQQIAQSEVKQEAQAIRDVTPVEAQ